MSAIWMDTQYVGETHSICSMNEWMNILGLKNTEETNTHVAVCILNRMLEYFS